MGLYQEALTAICDEISIDTGLTSYDVLRIGRSAYYRYKKYKIPKKKKGDYRLVGQPAREVKLLQRWVVDNLLYELPVHNCSTAYSKGASIKKNALAHVDNQYILKLDFSSFFPSIVPEDFFKHFRKYGNRSLTYEELEFVSKILFWKENRNSDLNLIIGAPSSPILSNTIMYDFDCKVNEYCSSQNMRYTRYADDICISSHHKDTNLAHKHIIDIMRNIEYPRLVMNDDKTIYLSKARNRKITGLVINNDNEISLGRDRKRIITAKVHYYLNGKLSDDEIASLKGLLSFSKDVEPKFIERLEGKYGKENVSMLVSHD